MNIINFLRKLTFFAGWFISCMGTCFLVTSCDEVDWVPVEMAIYVFLVIVAFSGTIVIVDEVEKIILKLTNKPDTKQEEQEK